ncbi:MAG TPA: hypothetical protein VMG08_18670 [Allosphingosinicella sp.]|nr:hypothetical protein [Allosphingosinicella sp.]
MHGVRALSIFAAAAALQIFLVVAIADLPKPEYSGCGPVRHQTLAEKLGLQDLPEVYEVFGIADAPPPPAVTYGPAKFGCIQY